MTKAPRTDADLTFDNAVGQRIRDYRHACGMNQTQLAKAAGVTFQQLQKYERGTNRVAASRLAAIAAGLGVMPSVLMGEAAGDAPALSAIQIRLLHLFGQATEAQRQVVLTMLESLTA